jgi:Trypsin-co-occurring domain 1
VTEAEIVEVRLPDGTPVLVRAERVEAPRGPSDVGLRDFMSFSQVTASVRGIAAELHDALQAAKPDVVIVDLGFDLAVKGSHVLALLAAAGAHASVSVRLEWHSRGSRGAQPADGRDPLAEGGAAERPASEPVPGGDD